MIKSITASKLLPLLGFLTLYVQGAGADIITEFGMGYKIPDTTSAVLRPECHEATELRGPNGEWVSADGPRACGGDNPLFIGWPVAWEREFSGPWTVRAGWFHMSHWFDGGSDKETHLDAAVVTVKFNWTKRNKIKLDFKENE